MTSKYLGDSVWVEIIDDFLRLYLASEEHVNKRNHIVIKQKTLLNFLNFIKDYYKEKIYEQTTDGTSDLSD